MRALLLLTTLWFTGLSFADDRTKFEFPTNAFDVILERDANYFSKSLTSEAGRRELFIGAWGRAQRNKKLDNLPYFFALSVDLFNSLSEPGGYCDGSLCDGKEKFYLDLSCALKYCSHESLDDAWEDALLAGSERRKEIPYIKHYIRSKVTLDKFDAPASVKPDEIDWANPRHYVGIQKWMAETVTARESNIAPWEAEEWNRNNGIVTFSGEDVITPVSEAVIAPATAPTVTKPEPAPQVQPDPEQPKTDPQPETQPEPAEDPMNSTALWGVMIAVVLGGIGALIWWNRNKKG